jgi:hypothetical protein
MFESSEHGRDNSVTNGESVLQESAGANNTRMGAITPENQMASKEE